MEPIRDHKGTKKGTRKGPERDLEKGLGERQETLTGRGWGDRIHLWNFTAPLLRGFRVPL